MPRFDYECDYCHKIFEVVQSFHDDALRECPHCEIGSVTRLMSCPTIIIKGDAKTVGQQADRNMAKLGHYEKEAVMKQHADAKEKAGVAKPKPKRPWWRKTDKINTKLAELSPKVEVKDKKIVKSEPLSEKAIKYIETGKLS